MSDRNILTVAIVIACLAAFGGFALSHHRTAGGTSMDPAHLMVMPVTHRDVQVKDLKGRKHSLSEWRGKILVVNFWATWCPPCVKEIPAFIELQARLGGRGLQFVGIALDDPIEAGKFAAARAVNYPILAGDDNVAELMRGLGNAIGGLPYTVVFDRTGNMVHTQQGEWSSAAALQVLEPLLGSVIAQQNVP